MADKQNSIFDTILPEGYEPLEVNETVSDEDGLEVIFTEGGIDVPEDMVDEYTDYFHGENLVLNRDLLTEQDVLEIGTEVMEDFESDRASREGWEETLKDGLKQIGLKIEELSDPFEGACSATHPLILEAAVKFQSKASAELYPARGPVRTQIMGAKTPEKEQKATRIQEHMNWQILEQMSDYYPQGEKMLLMTALMGSSFKKVGVDSLKNTPTSSLVPADQFVISNFETSLEEATRYSHIIYMSYNEMLTNINTGNFVEPIDGLPEPTVPEYNDVRSEMNRILGFSYSSGTEAEVYTLVEHHCYMDLGENMEGYELPYIVTVLASTNEVLAIRRNWDEDDTSFKKLEWFVHYPFVPGFGFYAHGLIQLLGSVQISLTTILRSLVDSGQFANLQGGFKSKSLKVIGDENSIAPGEWRDVEAHLDQDLSKAFYALPYKEPSPTLMQMLDFLESRGLKFADSTEQVIADSTNYGPVGTTLALLEASTKFYTAIHKRLHFAQGKELQILARINKDYLDPMYPYDVPGEERTIYQEDYDGQISVIPVSDPNISSNAHRMTLAQTKLQTAQQFPGEVNTKEALRQFYAAMGTDDIDEMVPLPEDAQELDPISDIITMSSGKPIRAFPGQDHDAHIQVKTAWIEDQSQGGNPLMQSFVPVIVANLREHTMLKWKEQMEGMTEGDVQGKVAADAAKQVKEVNNRIAEEGRGETPATIIAEAERTRAETEKSLAETDNMKNIAEAIAKIEGISIKKRELLIKEREQAFNEEKEGVKVIKDERDRELKKLDKELDVAVKLLSTSMQSKQQNNNNK